MKRTRILALSTATSALVLGALLAPNLASALSAPNEDGDLADTSQTETQSEPDTDSQTESRVGSPNWAEPETGLDAVSQHALGSGAARSDLEFPESKDDTRYWRCLVGAGESAEARAACADEAPGFPLWLRVQYQAASAPYTLDPGTEVTCIRKVATSADTVTLEPVEYDDMLAHPDAYADWRNITCDLANADGSPYPWSEVVAGRPHVNSMMGFRPGLMQVQEFESHQ